MSTADIVTNLFEICYKQIQQQKEVLEQDQQKISELTQKEQRDQQQINTLEQAAQNSSCVFRWKLFFLFLISLCLVGFIVYLFFRIIYKERQEHQIQLNDLDLELQGCRGLLNNTTQSYDQIYLTLKSRQVQLNDCWQQLENISEDLEICQLELESTQKDTHWWYYKPHVLDTMWKPSLRTSLDMCRELFQQSTFWQKGNRVRRGWCEQQYGDILKKFGYVNSYSNASFL